MVTLGISAYYHDSAAVLVVNGKLICAFEEERFSKIKHDNSFPLLSIKACLKYHGISSADIDCVAYYEKPLLRFERILDQFVDTYPKSIKLFVSRTPEWLTFKLNVESTIRKQLQYKNKIMFIPHHMSHASAAYYSSPFNKAAVLTVDGVGEYMTTGLWIGNKNSIKLLKSINYPNSLGLLYSTFTAFLGFRVNEGEYKMMGLAAYGKPQFVKDIFKIVHVNTDGSFFLDQKYFSFRESNSMWNSKFENIFGKPRAAHESFSERHKNIAASIQKVTEEIYFKILRHLYDITKIKNICVGGGVALNSLANGKIVKNCKFNTSFIFGPAGDSGGAVGAAFRASTLLSEDRPEGITSLSLGNKHTNKEIKSILDISDVKYSYLPNSRQSAVIANLLDQGHIIGLFQSRSEFGPRALGCRSLLGNPTISDTKNKLNKIKNREGFRPFAISVLEDYAPEIFDLEPFQNSYPHMNYCFDVKESWRNKISAAMHNDGTCRIQTITPGDKLYYDIVKVFYDISGIPCVINTSFNVAGNPIVESPEDAVRAFKKMSLDYLLIENYLVKKI